MPLHSYPSNCRRPKKYRYCSNLSKTDSYINQTVINLIHGVAQHSSPYYAKVGNNGNILTFLNNFLTNRSIQVKSYNNLSNLYHTENGLPQGSIPSVALFHIAIHNIFLQIQKFTK